MCMIYDTFSNISCICNRFKALCNRFKLNLIKLDCLCIIQT